MDRLPERYLVDENGNRIAVVLPVKEYEQLLEALEELEDIRAFDEAIASGDEHVPLDEVVAKFESLQTTIFDRRVE
jgi:PHD/YefM family antitoxin component YafN of YafNO toxin-antitoxin module